MTIKNIFKSNGNFLFLILGLALTLRLIFFFIFFKDNPCLLAYDSGHYHTLAQQIVTGKGLTNPDGSPQFYRLPAYPLFLACCYTIFNNNIILILLIQILLSLLIPLFVFALAKQLIPDWQTGQRIAFTIAALHPGYAIFSGLIMSETLFTIFFLLFQVLLFSALRHKNPANHPIMFFLSGVSLGLASLARPVGHFVLAMTTIVCLLFLTIPWLKKLWICLLLGTAWICVVGWLLLRNFLLTGCLFFSTLSGPHFINHVAVPVIMKAENISFEQAQEIVLREVAVRVVRHKFSQQGFENPLTTNGINQPAHPECFAQQNVSKDHLERADLHTHPLPEIQKTKIQEQVTLWVIKKYPLSFAKHALINIFKTGCSLYASELLLIDSCGQLPPYSTTRSLTGMIKRFLFPDVKNHLIIPIIYLELLLHLLLILGLLSFLFNVKSLRRLNIAMQLSFTFYLLFVILAFACGFARLRLPVEHVSILITVIVLKCMVETKKGLKHEE